MATKTDQAPHAYTLYCRGDSIWDHTHAASDADAMSQLTKWADDATWTADIGTEIEYLTYRGHHTSDDLPRDDLVGTYTFVVDRGALPIDSFHHHYYYYHHHQSHHRLYLLW